MLAVIESLIARSPHREMSVEVWPNGQAIVAYRGPREQSEKLNRDDKDSAAWACQQSLTLATDPETQRKPRGHGGITRYGTRMVESAAALFEDIFRRTDLTFGTATLPRLTRHEMTLVARDWPEITRRFFEELKREARRNGLADWELVYVTEIQIQRWLRSREVALHLHWLCPGRNGRRSTWALTPKRVTAIWERVLSRAIGRSVACPVAIRLEVPRGSLQNELGKYLSKGCKVIGEIIAAGLGDLLPPSWWGGASSTKRSVHKNKCRVGTKAAWALLDRIDQLRKDRIATAYHCFIDDISQPSAVDDRARWWVATSLFFKLGWRELKDFFRNLEREMILA